MLHVGRQLPASVTLAAILERSFPEEYAARREEARLLTPRGAASAEGDAWQAPLPLFVMSCVLPGAPHRKPSP